MSTSYTPHTWVTGEVIEHDELNNLEAGVGAAHDRIDAANADRASLAATVAALPVKTYVDSADSALSARVGTLEGRSLATVATSGSYSDLTGRPTLATVALTGSYNDLLSKPTLYTDSQVRTVVAAALLTGSANITIVNNGDGTLTLDVPNALANMPARTVVHIVQNANGTWPNRPTSRTDVLCFWVRIVNGSADPAAVTSPAVNGAYTNDIVVGA